MPGGTSRTHATCDEALKLLHVQVDLVAPGASGEAVSRDTSIAALLAARGPCTEDYKGLLAAVT